MSDTAVQLRRRLAQRSTQAMARRMARVGRPERCGREVLQGVVFMGMDYSGEGAWGKVEKRWVARVGAFCRREEVGGEERPG
jgi:hypothetical protein